MPAILRIVDDELWTAGQGPAGDDSFWQRLASFLVPFEVIPTYETPPGRPATWTLSVRKTGFGVDGSIPPEQEYRKTWDRRLTDKGAHALGVPISVSFFGGSANGLVSIDLGVKRVTSGGAWEQFLCELAWVPEVIRLRVGRPHFLELQLLSGTKIDWIKDFLGPAENPLFGGEWDVLCLDKRRAGLDDFHEEWHRWYDAQGLVQAYRTFVLYSNRDEDTSSSHRDAFVPPDDLRNLPKYPQHDDTHPALMRARRHLAWRAQDDSHLEPIVIPEHMIDSWRALRRASELSGGILIYGPSGTGKTAVAGLAHRWSGRAPSRFVYANCGGFLESMAKDELVGHLKHAWTGAETSKLGLLTLADGGTLFLDEVHLLPDSTQRLLLDVLDRGKFVPLGSTTSETTDLRTICASNKVNIVESDDIAEDLRNRLFHHQFRLPPLEEYSRDDFSRLVSVCWDRLKEEVTEHFEVSSVGPNPRGDESDFESRKQRYETQAPKRGLSAAARAQDRFRRLDLADDGRSYLYGSRSQLSASNVRGLVAWMRRAMLQCPLTEEHVGRDVLESCSPKNVGLVREQNESTNASPALKKPYQLAEIFVSKLTSASAAEPVTVGAAQKVIVATLEAEADRGFEIASLMSAFHALRDALGKRWVSDTDGRPVSNDSARVYKRLFKHAIPALGHVQGSPEYIRLMKEADSLIEQGRKRKGKTAGRSELGHG